MAKVCRLKQLHSYIHQMFYFVLGWAPDLDVHSDAEVLAEGHLVQLNEVEVYIFAVLLGEGVVLLGPLHPSHSIEHRQPLGLRT